MTNLVYTNADLRLDLQLYEGDVTLQEYAERSPEYREAFRRFCQKYGQTVDEKAAGRFFDWLLEQEEQAHTDGLD